VSPADRRAELARDGNPSRSSRVPQGKPAPGDRPSGSALADYCAMISMPSLSELARIENIVNAAADDDATHLTSRTHRASRGFRDAGTG